MHDVRKSSIQNYKYLILIVKTLLLIHQLNHKNLEYVLMVVKLL